MTNEIKAELEVFFVDAEKFEKNGNSAAGTRARKSAQKLKTLFHNFKKEVSDIKNSKSKEVL